MNNSKKITDGALMTGVFIVLLLIAVYIPVLNIIAMLALPVPFVLYASRYDLRAVGLMFVVSHLLALLVATLVSIPLVFLSALGGILVGVGFNKKLTPYETWASGSIGFVIGLVFLFAFSQVVFDVNWIDEANQMIDESLTTSESMIESLGMADSEDASEKLDTFKERFRDLTDYMPVGLAVAAIFMAFVTQWLSYKTINRIERKAYRFPPFRTFRLPTSLIWIYFFTLIASFFVNEGDSLFWMATDNALILTGLFMTLQGFSFMFFFADAKGISKGLPITVVVISFLTPVMMFAIARIVGIIDIGFGLRDRLESNDK